MRARPFRRPIRYDRELRIVGYPDMWAHSNLSKDQTNYLYWGGDRLVDMVLSCHLSCCVGWLS